MASVLALACPAPTLISANHASAVLPNVCGRCCQPSAVQCAREPGRYERCASTSRRLTTRTSAALRFAARTRWIAGWSSRHRDMEVGHRILRRTGVTALAVAVAITVWCLAADGSPKDRPDRARRRAWRVRFAHQLGVVAGGTPSPSAAWVLPALRLRDPSSGRADVGDVLTDIGVFIEGWAVEIFTKGFYDAELERTRGYALAVLLIPVYCCSGTTSSHC